MFRVFPDMTGFARQWSWFANYLWIIAMFEKNLNVSLTTPQKKRKYPIYPEIPRNTRKYPTVKKIPENTRSYISTLLPDPNPTRYPVFFLIPDPTRPDIEKPYPLGTGCELGALQCIVWVALDYLERLLWHCAVWMQTSIGAWLGKGWSYYRS